jgi:hypothetical protein
MTAGVEPASSCLWQGALPSRSFPRITCCLSYALKVVGMKGIAPIRPKTRPSEDRAATITPHAEKFPTRGVAHSLFSEASLVYCGGNWSRCRELNSVRYDECQTRSGQRLSSANWCARQALLLHGFLPSVLSRRCLLISARALKSTRYVVDLYQRIPRIARCTAHLSRIRTRLQGSQDRAV